METEETAVGTHNIAVIETKPTLVFNKLPKQFEHATFLALNVRSEKLRTDFK